MAKERNKRATNERTNKQLARTAIQSNRSRFKIESERERELKTWRKTLHFYDLRNVFNPKFDLEFRRCVERVLSLSLSLSPLNKTKLDWFTNKTYVRRLRRLL
jgi:hypothetical protein